MIVSLHKFRNCDLTEDPVTKLWWVIILKYILIVVGLRTRYEGSRYRCPETIAIIFTTAIVASIHIAACLKFAVRRC